MFSQKLSVGQALARLRQKHGIYKHDLAPALHTNGTAITKIERDEKELSFIMAVKLCRFYDIDLNELVAMISDEEIDRKEIAALRFEAKRQAKQLERVALSKISNEKH